MRIRIRVTQWGDPFGLGIYGQRWSSHYQIIVALFWWSFIVEAR